MRNSIFFAIILLILILVSGCAEEEKGIDMNLSDEVISKVKSMNIYFGHMSVGYNILDGVASLSDDISIKEYTGESAPNSTGFWHSMIGTNTRPLLKIEDFENKMNSHFGEQVDVAFLKFCYVDITQNTDVDSLFTTYKNTMKRLEEQFPQVTFVHLTAPLMVQQSGIKAFVKEKIGREPYGAADNRAREKYNQKIRGEFTNVFDLAQIESTNLDGKRLSYEANGVVHYNLVPDYTNDGGHLNDLGARVVASKLLTFLSDLK